MPGIGVISLVLPVYNAGAAVERSWMAVRDFVCSQPEPWEAIVVCDGCTDGSDALLDLLADPQMRVIRYHPNRGKGYAVRNGLLAARGDWRIFTDIDLAYSFDDIRRLADTLLAGADVAIASREHPESQITLGPQLLGYAWRRRLQSKIFGTLARQLLPLAQRDTQAGLKGMTAAVADWLLPHMECDGFGFDCELLTACRIHQVGITEVPVTVRLGDAASTTGSQAFAMFRELWQIRRRWHRQPIAAPVLATPLRKAA
jgi:dolichyl-phosphate beta-glucosyltransferase